jgi:hypothetical protein
LPAPPSDTLWLVTVKTGVVFVQGAVCTELNHPQHSNGAHYV